MPRREILGNWRLPVFGVLGNWQPSRKAVGRLLPSDLPTQGDWHPEGALAEEVTFRTRTGEFAGGSGEVSLRASLGVGSASGPLIPSGGILVPTSAVPGVAATFPVYSLIHSMLTRARPRRIRLPVSTIWRCFLMSKPSNLSPPRTTESGSISNTSSSTKFFCSTLAYLLLSLVALA